MDHLNLSDSWRKFLKDTIKLTAGTVALGSSTIVLASSVFGKNAPSNKINIGQIGCGSCTYTRSCGNV